MSTESDHTSARPTIEDVIGYLQVLAPLALAEPWDNVGLLWGDGGRPARRVMTCLTLTSDVAKEAIDRGADLVVSHHPILFRPIQRLTTGTSEGKILLALAASEIAVYSAHTAYDSAPEGINQQLADQLGLRNVTALKPILPVANASVEETAGAGRFGKLIPSCPLRELAIAVQTQLNLTHAEYVGSPDQRVERLAIACGSGIELLDAAIEQNCQALLTGEARFHAALQARESGLGLILIGHYASEKPAMNWLALNIQGRFPSIQVWGSAIECDPIQHVEFRP